MKQTAVVTIVIWAVHFYAVTALRSMLTGKYYLFCWILFLLFLQCSFVSIDIFVSSFNFNFCYRCTPPHKSTDYQKIYSDWCNEFEKYKSAMKSWEKKQVVSVWQHWAIWRWTRNNRFIVFFLFIFIYHSFSIFV